MFETRGGRLQPVLMRPTPNYLSKPGEGGEGQLGGEGVPPGGGGEGLAGGPGGGGGVAGGRGGGLAGGHGGIQPGVRGEGLGLGLGSPSWWNQSWFYNPFWGLGWTYQV